MKTRVHIFSPFFARARLEIVCILRAAVAIARKPAGKAELFLPLLPHHGVRERERKEGKVLTNGVSGEARGMGGGEMEGGGRSSNASRGTT